MEWFNYIGLIFVVLLIAPNIIFAIKNRLEQNNHNNKVLEIFEQIGRYGSMFFMIFNIPFTYIGFYFSFAEAIYIIVNALFVLAYLIIFAIMWKKGGIVKALLLSIIPSLIFIFSGVMIASIPLFVFAIIFAVTHIMISVKNSKSEHSVKRRKKIIITIMSIILSVIVVGGSSFGGVIGYQMNQLSKLQNMSALDMIKYDASSKGAKISVAIIENGNITYHVYGSNGKEDTIYDYEIGSISKTFVGLLAAKAEKDGKLNMSDSISKYLGFDDTKYYPTIERLLTHTSGYKPYYFEIQMIGNEFSHITNDFYGISKAKVLEKARSVSLEDKDYPFAYSNFGISVMGLVLEKIYNKDFTTLMNDYIKNELSLNNTAVAKQSGNLSNYWKWKTNDGYIPAGAIVSNITDMASYLNFYLTEQIDYSVKTYAKIKEINANTEVYEKMNIRMDSAGMTWIIDDKNNIIWHNGATTNFNSYIGFTKDKQKGVVILSNLSPNDKISMTVIGAKLLTSQDSL